MDMVVAEKRRVKNDAKLVVNLKEERGRERLREEKEDAKKNDKKFDYRKNNYHIRLISVVNIFF